MLNCKVKCVDNKSCFIKDKIYEVVNGRFQYEDGGSSNVTFDSLDEINKFYVSKFELYEEPKAEKSDFYNYWTNICKLNERQESKGKSKYGQSLEENTTLSTTQRIEHLEEELLDGLKYCEHLKKTVTDSLSANDYQRQAMRTAGEYNSEYDCLRNAAYGLNGEAGELIDLLKKYEFQGHELDKDKLIDELGDVQWYIALAATAVGKTLEEIMQHNVDKLKKRYPEGFDKNRSINRIATVDVQPVVHGKWICENAYHLPKCSVCGKKSHSGEWHEENSYCGHCGAKMEVQNV